MDMNEIKEIFFQECEEQLAELVRAIEHLERTRQQHPPGLVEAQPLARAIEQRPPGASFEFGERGACRRLRQADPPGAR